MEALSQVAPGSTRGEAGAPGSSSSVYRPTYFELYASEKLQQSLKAALTYSLAAFGDRRPGSLSLLDIEDELFAILSWVLESQSLRSAEGSFAESLYGLKRVPTNPQGASTTHSDARRLSPLQQKAALLVLVYLPYFRSKLDRAYSDLRERIALEDETEASLLSIRREQAEEASSSSPSPAHAEPPVRSILQQARGMLSRAAASLHRRFRTPERTFVSLYPWLHLGWEGTRFCYQLAYLLERTDYFSPELHLLHQVVSRVGAVDLRRMDGDAQRRRKIRSDSLQNYIAFLPARWREVVATALLAVGDNARAALVIAVFGFKLAEWWYTAGEERMGLTKPLPPPPPPPAPPPDPAGLPVTENPALCPVCLKPRKAPTLLTCSGYLYCYKCLTGFVRDHGCCPVTRFPATMDHLRRVYVE